MTQPAPQLWPVGSAAGPGTPAGVTHACLLVGHDLLADAAVRAALPGLAWWWTADALLPAGFVTLGLAAADTRLAGFGIDPRLPTAELVMATADRVQQHLVGYEMLQWPRCGDGRHVLQPAIAAGTAVWTCPGPAARKIRIGEWAGDDGAAPPPPAPHRT